MAQVIAGEMITIVLESGTVTAKVEDASKSDLILAKVETSSSPDYNEGQVYEFDRNVLQA